MKMSFWGLCGVTAGKNLPIPAILGNIEIQKYWAHVGPTVRGPSGAAHTQPKVWAECGWPTVTRVG